MDEGLRRHLKVRRDMEARGYTYAQVIKNIERRVADAEKFIKPQQKHADLIFSLEPVEKTLGGNSLMKEIPRLSLKVESKNSERMRELYRSLIAFCGLHINLEVAEEEGNFEMIVDGEVYAEDIAEVVQIICPDVIEMLSKSAKFHSGMLGVMQLVTLTILTRECEIKP